MSMHPSPRVTFTVTALDVFHYYYMKKFDTETDHEKGIYQIINKVRADHEHREENVNLARTLAKLAVEYRLFQEIGASTRAWFKLNIESLDEIVVDKVSQKVHLDSNPISLVQSLLTPSVSIPEVAA